MDINFLFRQIYFKTTGYSFTHLGRMFLRLFVGMMLAQFGVRQLLYGVDVTQYTLLLPNISGNLATWIIITVEIICSFFIMIGFFMRLAIIPPMILMISSCHMIFREFGNNMFEYFQLLTVPFLFLGIFFFLFIVGPGKISVDYFLSLYLINRNQDKDKEEDLEEV